MSNAIDFPKYWKKFSTQLRGQLMSLAKNDTLMDSSANLALSSSIGFWDDRHAEGRKWLEQLESEEPERARLIENILVNDMHFENLGEQKEHNQLLKYGIPLGGAVAGFAVSKALGATPAVQVALTAGSAIVGYPIANSTVSSSHENAKNSKIDAYMKQLEKYELSIKNILDI